MYNWKRSSRPILALSPMADMTDSAFSRLVKSKANPVIFREMVSSEAIVRGNEKTLKMTNFFNSERPIIQQIFGSNPKTMAKAASIIEQVNSPDGIDINMGCPVYKMTSNFNGAALMKDVDLAIKIVKKVKEATGLPVSVKMRAGWSDHKECIDFAPRIEEAGADAISIHGRTQKQGYSGKANRDVVKIVKKNADIPILYNGDIFIWEDFFEAIKQTNCDGALIARGALGNPWIFQQIEQYWQGEDVKFIDIKTRVKTVREHLKMHIELYGESSVVTFRKHLSWYFKGIQHFKKYKIHLMTAKTKNELNDILKIIENDELLVDEKHF